MYEARTASAGVGRGALEAMEMRNRRWVGRKKRDGGMGIGGGGMGGRVNGPVELGVSERHECEYEY